MLSNIELKGDHFQLALGRRGDLRGSLFLEAKGEENRAAFS